jgi:acyl-CoA thioester hydrolase
MAIFKSRKRVYYHDTDCAGVVYYANYLEFLEEARTEQFRSLGIDLKKLGDEGIIFAVAGLEIKYKSPARYNDELTVSSEMVKAGRVFLDFGHRITIGDKVICECRTRLVCLGTDFKPATVPDDIIRLLRAS